MFRTINCIESLAESPTKLCAKFRIESFSENGAIALAIPLRWALMEPLSGIRVIGVKAAGFKNPFSNWLEIQETPNELLENIRDIAFCGKLGKDSILSLHVRGPKIVTTKDIKLPKSIRTATRRHYIATINKNYTLDLKLKLSEGTGEISASKHINFLDPKFLPINANFNPVRRVNTFTERHDFGFPIGIRERLILEIETNGSIQPHKALIKALNYLACNAPRWTKTFHLNFQELDQVPKIRRFEKRTPQLDPNSSVFQRMPIRLLQPPFSEETRTLLFDAGIKKMGELTKTTYTDLKKIEGMTDSNIKEILDYLNNEYNMRLVR